MNNFKNCHETILTVTSERFMNVKLREDYTKISLQSTVAKNTGLRTSGLNTGGPAKCNYVTLIGG